MQLFIKATTNKVGYQIGYAVHDLDAGGIVATFKNRDFGGAAFWRRAKGAPRLACGKRSGRLRTRPALDYS